MSRPHPKSYPTTVFIVEGITTAILVIAKGKKMTQSQMDFASPEAALAWCRAHRAGLVYSPAANPAHN